MSIGGNCADIGFLGRYRTHGPVDNVLAGTTKIIELLLNNKYENFVATAPHIREPRVKNFDTDCETATKYGTLL